MAFLRYLTKCRIHAIDYNDILMKFDRIKGTSQAQEVIKILPNPLFIANCDN